MRAARSSWIASAACTARVASANTASTESPGGIDDASARRRDAFAKHRAAVVEVGQGRVLIVLHEPRITGHIGRQYRR